MKNKIQWNFSVPAAMNTGWQHFTAYTSKLMLKDHPFSIVPRHLGSKLSCLEKIPLKSVFVNLLI